ncbi:MAG: 2-oxoacid:acceptor oxidoreductase family protein [Polyangia bacterium]
MSERTTNIYLSGVGGQGIGLLAEVLGQSCLAAGHRVRGCDTHGLAQRHGTVASHIRLGEAARMPRVPLGEADLILGLERLETLRAIKSMLKNGGVAIYYDTVYQPIHVRMKLADYPGHDELAAAVKRKDGRLERVLVEDLADPRMQNVALFGRAIGAGAVPGVSAETAEEALAEAVPPRLREENLAVFRAASG